jgi:uncharacterized lipoprotein YddW (UPF0748 family)
MQHAFPDQTHTSHEQLGSMYFNQPARSFSLTTAIRRGIAPAMASLALLAASSAHTFAQAAAQAAGTNPPASEVRGTWLTTTANDAISTPAKTAETMQRLRDIGLNTVYVECWKNGYTQYPSQVLFKTIGEDRRPALMKQDPSDEPEKVAKPGRDLLGEAVIEAHRNGLLCVAWFEYGFMASHKSFDSKLRQMKPDWLSRDINGNDIAPNGFAWMNPLHPEARRFLLDLVLEAVDRYDLDGIQLDDRIVWPYINMGYDDYTKKVYASEHQGKEPPTDFKDPEWTRWRADKVNEYAKLFTQEIRARRPDLLISLSPAVYPWVYENYCLEWPKWGAWTNADKLTIPNNEPASNTTPRWDEFIPQVYRFSYKAYEQTWLEQVKYMNELGGGRVKDMIAGIRVVGEGADSTWEDLVKSIELVRTTGGGGHVHWFSRGVLDVYPKQLTEYYNVAALGRAENPRFPSNWRLPSTKLTAVDSATDKRAADAKGPRWTGSPQTFQNTRVIIKRAGSWNEEFTITKDGDRLKLKGPKQSGSFSFAETLRMGEPQNSGRHSPVKLLDATTALEVAVWTTPEGTMMDVISIHDRAAPDSTTAVSPIEAVELLRDRRGDPRIEQR